jgi:acetoacetyl-CoA synthetase
MSELLWQPAEERIKNTNMYHFMEYVNARCGMNLANYGELYGWSIEESPAFWEMLWAHSGVIHSRSYHQVVDDIKKMPGARWFEGARLNFAENLLRYRDHRIALSLVIAGFGH